MVLRPRLETALEGAKSLKRSHVIAMSPGDEVGDEIVQ